MIRGILVEFGLVSEIYNKELAQNINLLRAILDVICCHLSLIDGVVLRCLLPNLGFLFKFDMLVISNRGIEQMFLNHKSVVMSSTEIGFLLYLVYALSSSFRLFIAANIATADNATNCIRSRRNDKASQFTFIVHLRSLIYNTG